MLELRGAANLQQCQIPKDLDVLLVNAQGVFVALDGFVIVVIRAVQKSAQRPPASDLEEHEATLCLEEPHLDNTCAVSMCQQSLLQMCDD